MKTTIDIRKALWATFGYINQEGTIRTEAIETPTVNGREIELTAYAYPLLHDYPHETQLERALRLGILDRWQSIVIFHFHNHSRIERRGAGALALFQAYNAYIFNKKKGKNGTTKNSPIRRKAKASIDEQLLRES